MTKKIIECECGWKGKKEDLYHRNDCGENWWCDQLECPDCLTVIINNLEKQ